MRFTNYNAITKCTNTTTEQKTVEYQENETFITESTEDLGILNFLSQDPWTLASNATHHDSSEVFEDEDSEEMTEENCSEEMLRRTPSGSDEEL